MSSMNLNASRLSAKGPRVRLNGIISGQEYHGLLHGAISTHHKALVPCRTTRRVGSQGLAPSFAVAVGVARVANTEAESESMEIEPMVPGGLLAGNTNVTYRFIVPEYVTQFGEVLKVVGSCPELGDWDLSEAPPMVWNEGHKWMLEVRLPKEDFEFKVVALVEGQIRWEQGGNRLVKAEGNNVDVPVELVINLTCNFDSTWENNMELVLNRTNIQESYELASATLELLEKRRTRLVRTLQETTTQGPAVAEQQAEAARLNAAVNNQYQNVSGLQTLLTSARLSEDGQHLLVSMTDGKVEVPPVVGSLSSSQAVALSLALGDTQSAAQTSGTLSSNGTPAGSLPLSSIVGNVVSDWGREEGQPTVGHVAGSSSGVSESDAELGADDVMAAAAYAGLSSSKKRRRRAVKTRGLAPSKPADAPAVATPATTAAASATTTATAAAGDDVSQPASPSTRLSALLGDIDLSDLPPPEVNFKGELFFSEAVLAAVKLPTKRINLTRRATPTLSRRTPSHARGRPATPVPSGSRRK